MERVGKRNQVEGDLFLRAELIELRDEVCGGSVFSRRDPGNAPRATDLTATVSRQRERRKGCLLYTSICV